MKKIIIAASIFLCSFSGNAATDPLGDFIADLPTHQLPLQKATVKPPANKNSPSYIKDLDNITPKQKEVLEYAYRVGHNYDLKTAKPVEKDKAKRLGYHLAAIVWIESRACENVGKGKKGHHTYGCWQVTARSASARMDKSYPKRVVIKKLETLQGGSKYAIYELEYWLDYHKGDLKKALASYNAGFKYTKKEARDYARMVNTTAKLLEEKQII